MKYKAVISLIDFLYGYYWGSAICQVLHGPAGGEIPVHDKVVS